MQITYTQSYFDIKYDNFTLYSNTKFNTTNVFFEYMKIIKDNNSAQKENLEKLIKSYKPTAKSKLRISYSKDEIKFFKPNSYVFPVFYIKFR